MVRHGATGRGGEYVGIFFSTFHTKNIKTRLEPRAKRYPGMLNLAARVNAVYTALRRGGGGVKRERFDSVLEPFQAVLQLCLLSRAPPDTKLAIHENCLRLQLPNLGQGILRWTRDDKKSDLMFLFQVCRRFPVLYESELSKVGRDARAKRKQQAQGPKRPNLFELMTQMASDGLKRLSETYSRRSGEHVIPQMLHLYSNVLLKPRIFEGGILASRGSTADEKNTGGNADSSACAPDSAGQSPSAEEGHIDSVFAQIRPKVYHKHDYWVVYHSLMKLTQANHDSVGGVKNAERASCILKSINAYFKATNDHIRALLLKSMVV